SYSNYSHMLLKQLWPGWSVRDAIICSSDCGRLVLDKYFNTLRIEYGLDKKFIPPLLKHIPLGIDSEKIYSGKSDLPLEKFIPDDKTNILCFGRISCYSKMDILPILKSFQLARIYGMDTRAVRLILAGGVDQKDDTIKKLLLFARNIGVELKIISNPDEQTKKLLLRDTHIFLSMSDNPQETFGLTILEAQAAGLPVVASDYNGYRELISHNKNGFLIPTFGPDKTEYIDDLAPLIFDSESHLLLAQSCGFDLHVLAETLTRLIAGPELRKKIGDNGKADASQYTWDKIIESYVLFWEELNNLDEKRELKDQKHPVHTSYSDIFSHYTTDSWINSVVSMSKLGQAVYREKDHLVIYSGLSHFIDKEKIRMLLFLSRAPIKTPALIARLCAALDLDQDISRLIISWAIKQGLLQTS
ncbi:MAG: glycosyltransferase family 4 protein, partial [Desulfonatronovibrio sp.]